MIIYGEMIGYQYLGVGGGETEIPEKPEAWQWYQTITASGPFTAAKPMWVRLHVIGDGGAGGRGGQGGTETYNGRQYVTCGGGGGGGATGGYAIYDVYLQAGQAIDISHTSSQWQAAIGDATIYAEHGGDGKKGSTYSDFSYSTPKGNGEAVGPNGSSGTAGEAGGGNVLNLSGVGGTAGSNGDGGNSAKFSDGNCKYGSTTSVKGGSGAYGKLAAGDNGGSASGSTSGADTKLGGAGAGGGGSTGSGRSPGSGGEGYTGGVVIEVGVDTVNA